MWIVFLLCGVAMMVCLRGTFLKNKSKAIKTTCIVIASVFCVIVAYSGARELAREMGKQAAISDLQKMELSKQ